jgi:flagellar assembly protein FliH
MQRVGSTMAGVIRAASDATAPRFSFSDIEAEAQAIVQRATRRAAEIAAAARAQAQREAAEARAAAHAAGLEEGRRRGLEDIRREAAQRAHDDARQRLGSLASALASGVRDFESAKRRLLAEAEAGLIELALAAARRACKLAAGASSEAALANARHVIALARDDADLVLHVSPADAEALRGALPDLLREIECAQHVTLHVDESLSAGGCVLRGRNGRVDADLDAQLDRLAESLLGRSEPAAAADGAQA